MPVDVPRNANIAKLAAGYLFPTIGKVQTDRQTHTDRPPRPAYCQLPGAQSARGNTHREGSREGGGGRSEGR